MRRITKLGGYAIAVGAGIAAFVWLAKDRLLGPENALVSPAEAPAFRVASGPPTAVQTADDDLSHVKGIGPVYRARLQQAGIATFAALSSASATEVAATAEVAAEKSADWIRQAADLAAD